MAACSTSRPKPPAQVVHVDQSLRIWVCDERGCEIRGYMFNQTCSGKPCR